MEYFNFWFIFISFLQPHKTAAFYSDSFLEPLGEAYQDKVQTGRYYTDSFPPESPRRHSDLNPAAQYLYNGNISPDETSAEEATRLSNGVEANGNNFNLSKINSHYDNNRHPLRPFLYVPLPEWHFKSTKSEMNNGEFIDDDSYGRQYQRHYPPYQHRLSPSVSENRLSALTKDNANNQRDQKIVRHRHIPKISFPISKEHFDRKGNFSNHSTNNQQQRRNNHLEKTRGIFSCFDCKEASKQRTEKNEETDPNNFIFHKVNVDTSYDPFTKRPYHRTVLAMRALPGSVISSTESQEAPTRSLERQITSRKDVLPQSQEKDQSFLDSNDFLYSYPQHLPKATDKVVVIEPNSRRDQQKKNSQYPPPEDAYESIADYEVDNLKRKNKDSLWIARFLENPGKFDTIKKQLIFFRKWLRRLDKREEEKQILLKNLE